MRARDGRKLLGAFAVMLLVLVLVLAAVLASRLAGAGGAGVFGGALALAGAGDAGAGDAGAGDAGAGDASGGDASSRDASGGHVLGKAMATVMSDRSPFAEPPPKYFDDYPRQQLSTAQGATGGSRRRGERNFEFEKLEERPRVQRDKPYATKLPKPRKPWTEYATWDELGEDKAAAAQYFADVHNTLSRLDLDWSDVRRELDSAVKDNREWIGRINMVDGKPRVVEKRPSPFLEGEVGDSRAAAAMVPGELVDEVASRPALFIFHTHPGLAASAAMPSSADVLVATYLAYNHMYAANLVISQYGVFLYRPNSAFMNAINESDDKRLTILRRAADTAAAISGSRSWANPWTLKDYALQLRRYGIELVVFPTDRYACLYYRADIRTPDFAHDFDDIQSLYERVAAREAELEAGAMPMAVRPKGRGR
jgi:hypothetical protein